MNYLTNKITILIDDRIVLSRLQKLNHKKIYPNACLLPEYEVIRAICTILKQIPNLTLRYQKSSIIHNDMTEIDPNDECTTLLENAAQLNLQNTPIPALSAQHTELIINNKHITTNYQQSIREAFTQPELWNYYHTKFTWTQQCIDLIDWTSHGKALASLPQRQQKTTIQFNHRWLPLNASHSLQAETTGRLCPHCQHDEETHQHYLQCPHPAPTLQWTTASQQIKIDYNRIINILITH
jgi:hypothetical protein